MDQFLIGSYAMDEFIIAVNPVFNHPVQKFRNILDSDGGNNEESM